MSLVTYFFYAFPFLVQIPMYRVLIKRYLKSRKMYTPEERRRMNEVKQVFKLAKPKKPEDVLQILQERVFESGFTRRQFFYDGMWKTRYGGGKYEHDVRYYYWSLPQFPKYMVVVATYEYGKVKIEVKLQEDKPHFTQPTAEVEAEKPKGQYMNPRSLFGDMSDDGKGPQGALSG